ncbi:Nramp family divalent metal transporter [Motilibacter aurantiacus]|uniref:Nramp family divalent metal transporter n=1 Tax=Motilibacter aurantiacus TaxID=2714955 RepID=UPI00140B0581|nr:Nramp family divalent metal transporter [Motilibacter aurantiacus]NHC43774.1 divalent metal cation transporter [Motilibacter aurantiacus]
MFDPALYDRRVLPGGSRRLLPDRRVRLGTLARTAGPGLVVAVAYVDPGNFATNVQAGALLGSRLLWVVLAASAVAMLVQYLAAKAGAVTGRSLPELCRDTYPRPVTAGLWVSAEVVAMATDFVEIVGGAIALHLLFGMPLPVGGALVGLAGTLLLLLRGRRSRFQGAVAALLAVIVGCFLYAAWQLGVGSPAQLAGGLVPGFGGSDGLLLATGIVGATIMPHAVYVHSALTAEQRSARLRRCSGATLRAHRVDVMAALGVATVTNAAILLVAASALHVPGATTVVDTLDDAYAGLKAASPAVGLAFVLALLVAGLAASCVGTYAGDVVMQGFLRRRVPVLVRRAVTLAPALALLCTGVEPTKLLLLSQVVLSVGLPAALLPLLHLTAKRSVMGEHVNRRSTTATAALACAAVVTLNGVVLATALG